MSDEFYSPSEHTLKMRRNLLFNGALCFIHTAVTPLSDVSILNVKLPAIFLSWALPISLIWFTFNYFYYLYAEYTQWRANKINSVLVDSNDRNAGLENMTLITQIQQFSKEKFKIKLCFEADGDYRGNPINPPPEPTDEIMSEAIKNIINYESEKIRNLIKIDLQRITEFQNSINKFNMANRLRFIILDLSIPTIVVILCLALAVMGHYGYNHIFIEFFS
ncbi:hypothetical protein JAB6_40420 [Janthinobacterium sp. HH104]|uniref:hypothetical protein n=1 Tax=Janthinobacterium sp. HH104 TaxID=1537276 RepID=UPI000892E7C8|nr:hypothetical protein [Janthinobacterium sp. HH104]OEZ81007.1 hypothetical protein JAB6_40420 [Janthinobacterium sp. HH104]